MSQIPIVAFVGRSGSGKTTLLIAVIAELAGRGWRVGAIKHHGHARPLDLPGKDTARLADAGAVRVVGASPLELASFERVAREPAIEELARRFFADVDLVLVEGYRGSDLPKIEVCRAARSRELACAAADLIAVASDIHFDLPDVVPQFDLNDAAGLAAWIEARFLRGR